MEITYEEETVMIDWEIKMNHWITFIDFTKGTFQCERFLTLKVVVGYTNELLLLQNHTGLADSLLVKILRF